VQAGNRMRIAQHPLAGFFCLIQEKNDLPEKKGAWGKVYDYQR